MSTEIAWLEQFTGIALVGADDPEHVTALQEGLDEALQQEKAYEAKREQQAKTLFEVRAELEPLRTRSQQLLSQKIKSGPLKGKAFLKIEGEQIDELDPDTLRMMAGGKKKLTISDLLPGKFGEDVAMLARDFELLGRKLVNARFEAGGTAEPLFTTEEIQKEYWAPLRLERIYPDGLVLDKFSETQQMLDATNQLYLDMCEEKRIAGELTPEIDVFSEVLYAGRDMVNISASVLSGFGGEQLELASDILQTMGKAFDGADALYKKMKESDYAGAAGGAIDLAGKLTSAVVSQVAGEQVGSAVAGGFSAGSSAVLMGKAFARYRSGSGTLQEALDVMGDMMANSLTLAAGQTSGAAATGLATASKLVASALRSAGLASGDLAKAVREGDFPGVVKALGAITKEVLSSLPGLEGQAEMLANVVDLGAAGAAMAYKMAVNARRGELLQAFNTAIADIGDNLASVLALAGVPASEAQTVVAAYKGSTSAARAVQLLVQNPGQVDAALKELSTGVREAFAATQDPVLEKVGAGIGVAVLQMVPVRQVARLYQKGNHEEALLLLTKELSGGIGKITDIATGSDEGGDGEDEDELQEGEDGSEEAMQQRRLQREERKKVSEELAEMVGQMKAGEVQADPGKLAKATQSLKAEAQRQEEADANEEARLLLAETALDLKALSEAERDGAEASNIERLIADLLRDRMILKIATQIAQGGADFLAQFVPALGAVSAGIKLAANLVAAAQRAQQLHAWIQAQGDLQAAQSALSSSAGNFVKNQGQQMAHYSAQAFFAAAQLAGKITELTAGPYAPVGTAIAALAGAGAKAEEALLERTDKIQIELAWRTTQKALRNPKNRQLGLEARKMNPSLAKFSIAWGAIVLKDPLARDAMRACGLTEASLKDDATDVQKVVHYLEVFYEDDKSLYRDSTEPVPPWIPKEPEVTLKWWSHLRLAAGNGPKLAIANASLLEGLLGELMAVEQQADGTADAVQEEKQRFVTLRGVMETAIKSMGVDDPVLEPPPIDTIVEAIDAHHAVVVRQFALLTQIGSAYGGCTSAPAGPGTTGKTLEADQKELQAVFKQLQQRAVDAAKVAEAEGKGVQESKLALQAGVEELRRKAAARARSLQEPVAT